MFEIKDKHKYRTDKVNCFRFVSSATWSAMFHGNIFRILGAWQSSSNAELQYLCCQRGQTIKHTVELLVIRDVMTLMWLHCNALEYAHEFLSQFTYFGYAKISYQWSIAVGLFGSVCVDVKLLNYIVCFISWRLNFSGNLHIPFVVFDPVSSCHTKWNRLATIYASLVHVRPGKYI